MKTKKSPLKILLDVCMATVITLFLWSFIYFWVIQDIFNLPERIAAATGIGIKVVKIYIGLLLLFVCILIAQKVSPKKTDGERKFDENEESGYGHIPRSIKDSRK